MGRARGTTSLPAVSETPRNPKKNVAAVAVGASRGGRPATDRAPRARWSAVDGLMCRTRWIGHRAKEIHYDLLIPSTSCIGDDNLSDCVPSVPRYSDSSSVRVAKHPVDVPKREDRALVVVLTAITFFVQMFSRDIWIPLFEPALIAFPAWPQMSVALFPFWNTVVAFLLMIPACVVINKYGIKTSLLSSSVISTLGAGLRCLPLISDCVSIVHLSAVMLSCASLFNKPLTMTISARCFGVGERTQSTGFLTSVSMFGTAAGLLTTIVLRVTFFNPTNDPGQWKTFITYTMYGCFVANAVCTLMVCVLFPREWSPNHAPYFSSTAVTPQHLPSVKTVFNNIDFVYATLSYVCSNAFSWPWYRMIGVTFSTMDVPQPVAADCQFWMIVHACLLHLSVSWLADNVRAPNGGKRLAAACHSVALLFMLRTAYVLTARDGRDSTGLLVGALFAFPLSWTTQSVSYGLIAGNAYPLAENVAVVLAETLKIACESSAYALMAVFPTFHLFWLHIICLVAETLSFVFILLVKNE